MARAATTASILVMVLACTTISVSSAALPPDNDRKFFYPRDLHVTKCWNSFSPIPGCVEEIFRSFTTGTIGIGPACCKVINEVADKCFPEFAGFYPFNPFLAPLIKAHCQNPSAPVPRSSLV